jgi:hypothetical protein
MNANEAIRQNLAGSDMVVQMYLSDLTDAELLVRPVPGANHIAWQLGHLIAAEHGLMSACYPGKMPPLPEGFADKYTTETAAADDPKAFLSKAEYLKLYEQQRAGTLKLLAEAPDTDFDKPAPEKFRSFVPTYGAMFNLQGSHWVMHAGQWAVTRRKLGRKPLF